MSIEPQPKPEQMNQQASDMEDMVAESDTGARVPDHSVSRNLLWIVPLLWSVFQLWVASPIPYSIGIGIFNDTEARAIHLAFSLFLAYLAFPTRHSSPRHYIPIQDWVVSIVAASCATYIWFFYEALSKRPGLPTDLDLVVAGVGLLCLLEGARRSLGAPLAIVAICFLGYVFFGSSEILPDVVRWKGASFEKAMTHMWLTTEGVFGIALGVSSGFVFLFVLFGALLNQAGAGNYFIQIAFSLLGHMRGGPAKAAVISSAMTGMISGSSIANVVTTGTFTIPLMKRVGFPSEKAGAVEVSSSVNGVLTPPVMGAVAFLMTEYVGISYIEVVKHAIIPALISYIALVYIVHLEAVKNDMRGLPRSTPPAPWKIKLLRTGIVASSFLIIASVLYHVVSLLKGIAGDVTPVVMGLFVLGIYGGLVKLSSKVDDLDPNALAKSGKLPKFSDIYQAGLYYLVPIAVLVWFLMVERKSPGLSALWSAFLMMVILVSQKPLKALFRKSGALKRALDEGVTDLKDGLVIGARNMIGIGIATATAGIIVGTVTLTGVGQVMAEFVELISGGNLLLMLIFVAMISMILGMGLPTTANYIVVSSLMAGVVVELGAQSGLIVPLVAVHMFCFYYGIMADVTPPVGLASFAAAAISGGDPLKTGFTAFFYSLRTALLPFLFIFNTDLLLIDVSTFGAIWVFVIALAAMLLFTSGTMGYFIVRNKLWESAALVLIAFTLFRPGFWLDMVEPAFNTYEAKQIYQVIDQSPDAQDLRVRIKGETIEGNLVETTFMLPLAQNGEAASRLSQGSGVDLREEDGRMIVDIVAFGSAAQKAGIDFDWEILSVELKNDRMAKEIFYLPAILLLVLVLVVQRRRREPDAQLSVIAGGSGV